VAKCTGRAQPKRSSSCAHLAFEYTMTVELLP
jgi:hypothetical protein